MVETGPVSALLRDAAGGVAEATAARVVPSDAADVDEQRLVLAEQQRQALGHGGLSNAVPAVDVHHRRGAGLHRPTEDVRGRQGAGEHGPAGVWGTHCQLQGLGVSSADARYVSIVAGAAQRTISAWSMFHGGHLRGAADVHGRLIARVGDDIHDGHRRHSPASEGEDLAGMRIANPDVGFGSGLVGRGIDSG